MQHLKRAWPWKTIAKIVKQRTRPMIDKLFFKHLRLVLPKVLIGWFIIDSILNMYSYAYMSSQHFRLYAPVIASIVVLIAFYKYQVQRLRK